MKQQYKQHAATRRLRMMRGGIVALVDSSARIKIENCGKAVPFSQVALHGHECRNAHTEPD